MYCAYCQKGQQNEQRVETGKTKVRENTANKFVVDNVEPLKQIDWVWKEVSLGDSLIWRSEGLDLERQIDLLWRWETLRDSSIWC